MPTAWASQSMVLYINPSILRLLTGTKMCRIWFMAMDYASSDFLAMARKMARRDRARYWTSFTVPNRRWISE